MKKHLPLLILLLAFSSFFPGRTTACFSFFNFNRACAGDTVWFHPIDPSAVYCWTFGDSLAPANVSFDQEPWHVYTTPGTYYVTLFTNVGAEWDYYTTVVEITADCFMADFTYDCQGSLQIEFDDYSVGNPTAWQWDFGDPASGTSNVSTLSAPGHTFTAAGTYNVQLIITDGLQADTLTRSINVYTDCIDANFGQTLFLPCWGDTFQPYVTYSGTITSYQWNFGDPGSGILNTSTLPNPIHVYWSPGIYTITLSISDGVMFDTTMLYVEVVDCRLWPGDVNRDGEVNGDDLFGIGLYYGNTGPIRAGATTAFTPQTAPEWSGFPNYMYLQDFLNAKHADCDGNGTIGAADVYAVNANFGMQSSNANNQSAMLDVSATSAELGFATDSVDAWSGATVEAPLSLGITDSAHRVYGFSATIQYDPMYISWVSADFFASWLGVNGINMQVVTHDDPVNGLFSVAAVRTDKTTRSGLGEVVRLYFHPGFLGGYTAVDVLPTAKVISNGQYAWMTNQMVVIPVELSHMKVNYIVGIEEQSTATLGIIPNPATAFVILNTDGLPVRMLEVYNMKGERISVLQEDFNGQVRIDVRNLSSGIYEIRAFTDDGVRSGRFLRQ